MAKKIKKQIEPLILMDDVSPLETIINKKSMKKSSKYYKKKKKSFVEIISEYNNFFILPAFRIWYDKCFDGTYDKMFFEISWFNYTIAFKIKG